MSEKCMECKKEFDSKLGLNLHNSKIHIDEKRGRPKK